MGVISAVLSDEVISASADFVITDWVLNAGRYVLNVQHALESDKINVAIWENNENIVDVDRVEIVDNNNLNLYTSVDPDCRFDGRIIIFKTQD